MMRELAFDPYSALGISRGADVKQVKTAYRRLAQQNHPDRSDDRGANERMKRINRAWEILSDPSRRAQYDAAAASAATPMPSTGHWTGARRRTTGWAPPPRTWSTASAGASSYGPPPVSYDDGERPSWPVILAVIVPLVLLAPVLLGILPAPFFGLLLLFGARLATRG